MTQFPVEAPKAKVIKTLQALGFEMAREGPHIAMLRQNPDGTKTPLTLPNPPRIKASTLRTICTQAGIKREDLLKAYEEA